jgi:hypothetical protein
MRVGLGLIVIGLLAIGTARQIPHFASDAALWSRAVAVHPRLPRPALNYGTQLRKAGRVDEALVWFLRAAETADRSTRAQEIRAGVAAQLRFLSTFGDDVCARPDVQPLCF